MLKDPYPIEQGLKLAAKVSKAQYRRLKDPYPIEQGLKLAILKGYGTVS